MTKAYLIFLIAFLSLMLFTNPVYAAENEGEPLEQQEEVQETLQEQEEDQQEQTHIVSTEEGVYNLTILVNANLRSEPANDSKSVIVIPFGIDMVSGLKITNTKGEIWYPISYSGMSGYISSDVVEAEAVYMNDSEEETTIQKEQKTPAKNSLSGSSSGLQTAKTENESKASDTSATDGSTFITTSEPKHKTVDSIFLIFLSASLAGLLITLIVFARLRHEYSRYRKLILKNRKDKAYEDQ